MPEEQNQPAIVELVIAEAALKKAEEFIKKGATGTCLSEN
jgi:hypothetical protein